MKVLYGIDASDHGSLSRARILARYFNAAEVEVKWIFTGKCHNIELPDALFPEREFHQGISLRSSKNGFSAGKTITANNWILFFQSLRSLRVAEFDLVISDFEPLTAWAARLSGVPSLGLSHRYASQSLGFAGRRSYLPQLFQRCLAPVDKALGIHWHHFGHACLPPIIDSSLMRRASTRRYTLVYRPKERLNDTLTMLHAVPDHQFTVYSPEALNNCEAANISLRTMNPDTLSDDLLGARAVICDSSFEMISECLALGIPVLTEMLHDLSDVFTAADEREDLPLPGVSQLLNTRMLTPMLIDFWLDSSPKQTPVIWPDVARRLVDYCLHGASTPESEMIRSVWNNLDHGALPG